jgi:outer membrane biosynthesis protein TonB
MGVVKIRGTQIEHASMPWVNPPIGARFSPEDAWGNLSGVGAGQGLEAPMGVSPVRFAVAASGAIACLMIGLVAGVRAGTNQTAHVMSVQTVTRTAHGHPEVAVVRTVTVAGQVRTLTQGTGQDVQGADAAARTVTRTRTVSRTVHDPVTVTETQTVTAQAPGPNPKPKPKPKPPKPKPPKPKPPHHAPGDGPGPDGGGGG